MNNSYFFDNPFSKSEAGFWFKSLNCLRFLGRHNFCTSDCQIKDVEHTFKEAYDKNGRALEWF